MEAKLTEITGTRQVRRLQTQVAVRKPISNIWGALAEAKQVEQWWSKGSIGKRAGETFQLGSSEDLNGRIIFMRAPHILEFTWHDNLSEAAHPEWIEPHTNGLVRFDLTEISEHSSLVTLVQFAPAESASGAAAGWHELLERLKAYLEDGFVEDNPSRFDELKKIYSH